MQNSKFLALAWLLAASTLALAAPLPKADVPDPLESWVPWVMHGHEVLACPSTHHSAASRT